MRTDLNPTSNRFSLPPELYPFRFLTDRQVEELTGIKRQTLANERHLGKSRIPYVKAGGSVRYALKDVLAYMDAHRIERVA